MHIQFYKKTAVILTLALSASSFAQEKIDSEFLRQAKAVSGEYSKMARDVERQSNDKAAMFREMAQDLASGVVEANSPNEPQVLPASKKLVFVSWSMGTTVLSDLVSRTQDDPSVQIIFRGVLKDEQFVAGIQRMKSLFSNQKVTGNVVINPTLFREYGIGETVPVVVITGENGKQLSRFEGAYNLEWIDERIEEKGHQDFGLVGQTEEVVEPDLIEVMKAKMQGIDWNEKKNAAKNRVWKNQKFHTLPIAVERNEEIIDLSVMASRDVVAPDGTVIVKQGTVINPLDYRPFTQTLVIFDPERKPELDAVLEMQRKGQLINPVFMMTNMETEKGWDHYRSLTTQLNAELFMLTNDVKARFKIEKTLTIVKAKADQKTVLKIEIPVGVK